MKVYLVCETYCWGYEDHGWEIKKSFFAEDAAMDFCNQLEQENTQSEIEYYVDIIEVV